MTTSYYLQRLLISQYNVRVKLSIHFFALPPHYTGCDQNHSASRSLPPPLGLVCCDVLTKWRFCSHYAQLIWQAGHGTLSSVKESLPLQVRKRQLIRCPDIFHMRFVYLPVNRLLGSAHICCHLMLMIVNTIISWTRWWNRWKEKT